MAIWRMRVACWITEDTHILFEYVIFTAFPLEILLHERARSQEIPRKCRGNNEFKHKEHTVINTIKVMIKFATNCFENEQGW
jgi:hypothetical protein